MKIIKNILFKKCSIYNFSTITWKYYSTINYCVMISTGEYKEKEDIKKKRNIIWKVNGRVGFNSCGRRQKNEVEAKKQKKKSGKLLMKEVVCSRMNRTLERVVPDGVGNGSKEPAARRQDVPLCGIPFDHRASNKILVRRTRFNDSAPCLSRNSFILPKICPWWTYYLATNIITFQSMIFLFPQRWTTSLFLCLKLTCRIISKITYNEMLHCKLYIIKCTVNTPDC